MKHLSTLALASVLAVLSIGATSPAGCGGAGTSTGSSSADAEASRSGHGSGDEGRREFRARLTGFQETPAISTPGHGTFRATLDDDQATVTFELSYADLKGVGESGAPAAAHIHLGQRGVAGGVAVFLCGGGSQPACPPQPATVMGTFVADDVLGPTAQGLDPGSLADLIAAARAGVTYVNVHTAGFSSGEIRGQIKGHDGRGEGSDDEDDDD